MGKDDLYSVIMPTYNERQNLPLIVYHLVKNFEANKIEFEVVVVDDNSPDGTGDVCVELQRVFGENRIRLLRRPGKMGLGSAYVAGMKVASGNFVFLMDADMSHNPRAIPEFVKRQKEGNFDIVTGTRYRHGGAVYGWNLNRKLTSRVANYLASVMLAPRASDLTGSYRLYKRAVLEDLIARTDAGGYVFQMAMMTTASSLGLSIAEVPITFCDRVYGESKLGPQEIVLYLQGLWKLFLKI
jgi:dolichol-phosphate mannosyltransferase